ncbi:MAG: DUF882 domain-containing protein [Bacteroidia bacterium]|nr:DUF882 domain-containing protein [Bacteroidia bacterium]
MEQVLSQLETISFANLDTAYIRKSNSKGDFKSMLQGKTYYNVKGEEVLLFLVDDFRLFEFMAKDEAFTANKKHLLQNLPQESAPGQYLLLNRRLPQKLLELMQELEKAGYNPHGFTINSCYRHPVLNLQMGSASRSRHIAGEAIDLHIRDINQDGQITQDDKTIVLDLLNKTIIKQTGGIGRYPGTMTVHFDVRGYGARWDSY